MAGFTCGESSECVVADECSGGCCVCEGWVCVAVDLGLDDSGNGDWFLGDGELSGFKGDVVVRVVDGALVDGVAINVFTSDACGESSEFVAAYQRAVGDSEGECWVCLAVDLGFGIG